MTKRRRKLYADRLIQNAMHLFCLLFVHLGGYYSLPSNPVLLYSTTADIRVTNTSRLSKVNVLVKSLEQGAAVDFLYSKQLICWSDQIAELIQCMNYNDTYIGEKMTIVSEGLITPTGIAIDWYTENIYWADGETNRIEVISIDQKCRKVLFWSDVDLARAIAVVPSKGLMFWTDWGEVPKIERAGMNGDPATRRIIVNNDILWPNGITVDYDTEVLYWVDAKLCFIDVVDFNGEKRKRIVKTGLVYPYALTYIDDKLFWTDWKTWAIHSWDMRASAGEGAVRDVLRQAQVVPVDVKAFGAARQPPAHGHACVNNGGCSHLCLLSPVEPGYTCACPTGVSPVEGSPSQCHEGPRSLLVVATRSALTAISLDSADFTPRVIPLKDLKRALTVDFDPVTELIYWADNLAETISCARLDGSGQSVVVRADGVPDSVAIDAAARTLYWTDPVMDTVNVASLDGKYKKVIVHSDLSQPRAVVVHPAAGWLFWSDWGERAKIERAATDGSGRGLVVGQRLGWPNGLAIDTERDKLYWGDARTHKIEMCDLDGSNRRELHSADILLIFGLTLLGDRLYWTDMQKRTLDRINKDTGLERQPVVEQMANMMGVKAIRIGAALPVSRCSRDNGQCSHLCFNRPQDRVCGCPFNMELGNDNQTCFVPDAYLLYSRKNIIGRISVDNDRNNAIVPIKDLKEVSAIAVHTEGSALYWADSKARSISRSGLDGVRVERLLENLGTVEGLCIDWSAQNMYWTDSSAARIEVARLDGSSRKALLYQGLKKPKSIALDVKRGYMYWSELGSRSIKRAGMDGSTPGVFVAEAGRVHALAADALGVCWAALDTPRVACRSDSGALSVLADAGAMPYALAVRLHRVYWGDWNTGIVESANRTDGSARRVINRGLDYISDLKVVDGGGGGKGGRGGQCAVDNGGCEHLCLARPGTGADYRCGCPAHYTLNADNVSCTEPAEYLLFAARGAVGRVSAAAGECADASIPLTGLRSVRAIDYDPIYKHLYWMDDESHSIKRVPLSYSTTSALTDSTVVVKDIAMPFSMVLDVVGRTLYWTCADGDYINATSLLNATSTGPVLRGDNMRPRQLAFHQNKRFLIWVDAGAGAVVRSNVDGTERVQLARGNVSALAVDQAGAAVYYVLGRQIHAVELNGNYKGVIWQGGWAGALAAQGGWLYLAGGERLMRVSLRRRDAPAAPVPHVPRVAHVHAVHPVSRSHPCYLGGVCGAGAAQCGANGACGCGLRCARAPPACEHFLCEKEAPPRCIPLHWKCDGQRDCADGADEAECGSCAGGVRCVDGACAATLGACGGGAHCDAGTLPQAFRCGSLCLPPSLVCDGTAQCAGGEDEVGTACPADAGGAGRAARGGGALAASAAVGGALCALSVAALALRRWRRRPRPPLAPQALPLCATKPVLIPSDSSTLTESSLGRYPRPTLNPPPSPASAAAASGGGGAGGGRRRTAYRHYRAINRPPPPTPASTDVGDSEPEPSRAPPPSPAPSHPE